MSTTFSHADFSLLDRLIDEDPQATIEPVLSDAERQRAIRECVERDVANLLNSRNWLGTWPPELELLRLSLLNYGLPDVSGAAIDNKSVQGVLSQTVRMALEVFEPRLSRIKVAVSTGFEERGAQLLISGELRGTSEPLVFRRVVDRRRSIEASGPQP
jgi:type VI secretion system protein ImpF